MKALEGILMIAKLKEDPDTRPRHSQLLSPLVGLGLSLSLSVGRVLVEAPALLGTAASSHCCLQGKGPSCLMQLLGPTYSPRPPEHPPVSWGLCHLETCGPTLPHATAGVFSALYQPHALICAPWDSCHSQGQGPELPCAVLESLQLFLGPVH